MVVLLIIIGSIGAAMSYSPTNAGSAPPILATASSPPTPASAPASASPKVAPSPLSPAPTEPSTPSSMPAAVPAPGTSTPEVAAPSAVVLTAYGALDTDWESHHRADPDFAPGAVYDTDPSLPAIGQYTGARYTQVEHVGGRVLIYDMNQYPGTPDQEAMVAVKKDLPGDVKLIWSQQKDTCMQYQFKSDTLAQVLGPLDPDGGVLVEFTTFENGRGYYYSPTSVGKAILANLYDASADTSGGC